MKPKSPPEESPLFRTFFLGYRLKQRSSPPPILLGHSRFRQAKGCRLLPNPSRPKLNNVVDVGQGEKHIFLAVKWGFQPLNHKKQKWETCFPTISNVPPPSFWWTLSLGHPTPAQFHPQLPPVPPRPFPAERRRAGPSSASPAGTWRPPPRHPGALRADPKAAGPRGTGYLGRAVARHGEPWASLWSGEVSPICSSPLFFFRNGSDRFPFKPTGENRTYS